MNNGDRLKTADYMGISRRTLDAKLKKIPGLLEKYPPKVVVKFDSEKKKKEFFDYKTNEVKDIYLKELENTKKSLWYKRLDQKKRDELEQRFLKLICD